MQLDQHVFIFRHDFTFHHMPFVVLNESKRWSLQESWFPLVTQLDDAHVYKKILVHNQLQEL